MTSASASRVTRSRRHLQLVLLALAGMLSAVTVPRAQDTAPAKAAEAAAASRQPAAAPARDAARTAGADTAEPSQPAAPTGTSPARFEPTEKVRADFDVSFPVDI